MNLRTYSWIALIIFLLGIGVMSQGWNRAPFKQQANQMQMAPAQTTPGQMPQGNMEHQGGNMNQPANSMQGGNK